MNKVKQIILLVETSGEFGRSIVRGATKYSQTCAHLGIWMEPLGDREMPPRIDISKADGLIVQNLPKNIDVSALDIPVILVPDEIEPPGDYVRIIVDDDLISEMVLEHFLSRGFRNYAYCGFCHFPWSLRRKKAFMKSVGKLGYYVNVYESNRSQCRNDWQREINSLVDWLRSQSYPLAVFACNDWRGRHLIEACKIAGLSIPEEISILGVDNDELVCQTSEPPLSSISLNVEKAGYDAMSVLYKMLCGKKINNKIIHIRPQTIIARLSTDITAVKDELLSQALCFIRDHCKERIKVETIAEALSVSRRTLEQRFRCCLNRSVHDEIINAQLQQIILMLTQTDMSLKEIAYSFECYDIKYIARIFRKKMGVTLMEYRQSNK